MASVRKRRLTYKGEPRETWVVNYTDHGGSRRQRTFRLKKDADAHRLRVENELEAGTHTPRRLSVTVDAAVEAMLDASKSTLRPEPHSNAEFIAKRYIFPQIGGVLLVDLSATRMQGFVDAMLGPDVGASSDTVEPCLWVLRRTIKHAVRKGWVSRNVIRECRLNWSRRAFTIGAGLRRFTRSAWPSMSLTRRARPTAARPGPIVGRNIISTPCGTSRRRC